MQRPAGKLWSKFVIRANKSCRTDYLNDSDEDLSILSSWKHNLAMLANQNTGEN